MFRFVGAVRRNLENIKKSSRVADESMVDAAGNELQIFGYDRDVRVERGGGGGRRHGGLSLIIYTILHAPISILSCVSTPHASGSDGVWVSGGDHFAHISEINHLMVNDSMRYAILM